jgi:hypothetical protein
LSVYAEQALPFHFTSLFIGLIKGAFYPEIEIMPILSGEIWLELLRSHSSEQPVPLEPSGSVWGGDLRMCCLDVAERKVAMVIPTIATIMSIEAATFRDSGWLAVNPTSLLALECPIYCIKKTLTFHALRHAATSGFPLSDKWGLFLRTPGAVYTQQKWAVGRCIGFAAVRNRNLGDARSIHGGNAVIPGTEIGAF